MTSCHFLYRRRRPPPPPVEAQEEEEDQSQVLVILGKWRRGHIEVGGFPPRVSTFSLGLFRVLKSLKDPTLSACGRPQSCTDFSSVLATSPAPSHPKEPTGTCISRVGLLPLTLPALSFRITLKTDG